MTGFESQPGLDHPPRNPRLGLSPTARLLLFALLSWLCYVAIALSARSLHETGPHGNGLLGLLSLFGIAFSFYLLALRSAVTHPDSWRLLVILWIGAVLFRVTLLVSNPIQEVDLYRYVWDGAVSNSGVSPFRYTPQQVLATSVHEPIPADLARLVRLKESSPELEAILRRVHFGELPTIYPPVSQVVFAVCSWFTPAKSSVITRLTLMKAWFVAFDLVTVWLVLKLLRLTNRHRGWAIAYAWCPLVIKEIANSGHLDALAMCLTILAMTSAIVGLKTRAQSYNCLWCSLGASLSLALGVGSKLYPVVLAPLLFWVFVKQTSWKTGLLSAVVFVAVTLTVLWPMLPTGRGEEQPPPDDPSVMVRSNDLPPLPPSEVSTSARDPSESLRAFLSRWEMNDFIFLLLIENLRPTDELPPDQIAWFTVAPNSWRSSFVTGIADWTGISTERVPFLLVRLMLAVVFVAVASALAKWAAAPTSRTEEPSLRMLEAAFLTLAWFWLMLPTQNPWYLLWCLPLLAFARSRAWLALSGLAFVYYVRFWMTARFTTPIFGTPYTGATFFDYVITWVEFAPWMLWLMLDSGVSWSRCRKERSYSASD